MARGYGQKELISKQRENETNSKTKLPIKEGAIIEFIDNPEWNGKVRRITKDQWQTISVDNSQGKTKILNGEEFIELYTYGKIVIIKK